MSKKEYLIDKHYSPPFEYDLQDKRYENYSLISIVKQDKQTYYSYWVRNE